MLKFAYHALGWSIDFRSALTAIRALGYQGVELFDLLDRGRGDNGRELHKLLTDKGLELSGTFVGASLVDELSLEREFDDFKRTLDLLVRLQSSFVILGAGRRRIGREDEDRKSLIEALNQLGEVANQGSVQLCLHPHFASLVSSADEIRQVIAATDPGLVKLCPDVGHLCHCGVDAMQIVETFADRIAYVHLKDFDPESEEYVPLGKGSSQIHEFCRWIVGGRYRGWLVTELDASPDPLRCAKENTVFLMQQFGKNWPRN